MAGARDASELVCCLRSLRRPDDATVVSNLVRERHAYKLSYETLQEVADIQKSGNLLHKIAFGILGRYPTSCTPPAASRLLDRTREFPSETLSGVAAAE